MLDLNLLLHALIVLLVGLLSGAPMGIAITSDAGEDKIRAWRVAHSGLSMGGVMLIVISLVVGHMSLSGISRLAVVVRRVAAVDALAATGVTKSQEVDCESCVVNNFFIVIDWLTGNRNKPPMPAALELSMW